MPDPYLIAGYLVSRLSGLEMQPKKEPPLALISKKVEVKDGILSSIKVSYEVPEIAWIGYVLKKIKITVTLI